MCSFRRWVTWIRSSRFPCRRGSYPSVVISTGTKHRVQSSKVAGHDQYEQAWDGVQALWIPSSPSFKNFPVCCDPHSQRLWCSQWSRSKCFSGNLLLFLWSQWMLAIWSLVPLPFLNPAWISRSSQFMDHWSLAWSILSITLPSYEMSIIVQ